MTDRITRRAVFFIGGYDPKTAESFFGRLDKEIARSNRIWGVSTSISPVELSPDGEVGRVAIRTSAGNWATETDFSFFVLDRIVLGDFATPLPKRLWKYLVMFADYVASGTLFRLFAASWRFGLYMLYPFFMLVVFAAAGTFVGRWLVRNGMPGALPLGAAAGLIVFFGLLATLGRRWSITHLMDLWSFSRDYLRGRRPDADAQLRRCGDLIAAQAVQFDYDEILLVGHSTGGALILDVAGHALAADRLLARRKARVCVLTLGSTALKIGLHPAAGAFRRKVQTLVDDGRIDWVEIQCLTDVINFYKTDPVALMELSPRRAGENLPFPLVRQVRMRDMLEDATYKRIKRNFFRVHYQYIFGNTKRYFYDFFMVCCGPVSLRVRAEKSIVGAGLSEEGTI
ncbi:hypothetical protein MesoLjLc_43520 [Mesorhizobium sp. L-8-10]|uniref:alpha/beta hydrolase n=1 Tax=Mesorhizobium sp. L-8-10 TaxID=2744523 RepID=UPI0019280542|nr:alpha/beta hydrolase [Mesorhizobium sp. L-8-10]BCH32422.1 hypothetical protein MesoLjLc_43520 [Mesorhizobium sp. L-8-10]